MVLTQFVSVGHRARNLQWSGLLLRSNRSTENLRIASEGSATPTDPLLSAPLVSNDEKHDSSHFFFTGISEYSHEMQRINNNLFSEKFIFLIFSQFNFFIFNQGESSMNYNDEYEP